MAIYSLGTPIGEDSGINQCNVLTIFPMGVQCIVTGTTGIQAIDGAIYLNITGGTPPYNVMWDNNNTGPYLEFLPLGSYTATVIDNFGDYTATTTCILQLPSPTPTPIPSPTPTPSSVYYDFCINITQNNTITRTHFTNNGVVNNKPSWISDDYLYVVNWNTSIAKWVYKLITYSGTPFVVNSNPSIPPINNWQYLGANASVVGNAGYCTTGTPLSMVVQTNSPIYGGDGSVVITPNGGVTPYQYSITNGLTYQNSPIFTNLNGGTLNLVILDASGTTFTQTVTLIAPPPPTVYTVNLNTSSQIIANTNAVLTKLYNTNISVSPQLPSGTTITLNLQHVNLFNSSPTPDIASATTTSILYKNSIPYTATTNSATTATTLSTLAGCQANPLYVKTYIENWSSVTITRTDSLSINTITSVYKNGVNNCYVGQASDTFNKSALTISGNCVNCVAQ
jgi:hypothetical protein